MHMLLFFPVVFEYGSFTITILLSDKVSRFFFYSVVDGNGAELNCSVCK